MNGVRPRVGNPYQSDWEDEEGLSVLPLALPRRSFNELGGLEFTPLALLEEKGSRVPLATRSVVSRIMPLDPWNSLTRDYLVSFAWFAFYAIASIAAAAVSLSFLANRTYLFLPASVLAFIGFTVLSLVRLSIHLREHRRLAHDNEVKRAA